MLAIRAYSSGPTTGNRQTVPRSIRSSVSQDHIFCAPPTRNLQAVKGILVKGKAVAIATKQRRGPTKPEDPRNGLRGAVEFHPGSLEAELAAIGKSAPAREWAKVPADYFANLDYYRHGPPKKK